MISLQVTGLGNGLAFSNVTKVMFYVCRSSVIERPFRIYFSLGTTTLFPLSLKSSIS